MKLGTSYPMSLDKIPKQKFDGVSLEGFLLWAKHEYDNDPKSKVTVKFIIETLKPSLLSKDNK